MLVCAGLIALLPLLLYLLRPATPPVMPAEDETLGEQRRAFVAAEQALAAADRETFDALGTGLADYPLHPYLRLADLMRRLDRAAGDEIGVFLERYRGTAPGERLRLHWLRHLAREGRWREYIDAYVDNGSETRECRYRHALQATGRTQAAFDCLDTLYLTGASLPGVCDPLLGAWAEAGGLTAELVWRRIDLALERGETGVARFQRRYLPIAQQPWLDLLLLVHAKPRQLAGADLPSDPHRREATVVHAVRRLARRDPRAAAELWRRVQDQVQLSEPALDRIQVAIGVAYAQAREHKGLVYLRRMRARDDNVHLQQQRLRAALRLRAWADLARWVEALPAAADADREWHY